MIAALVARAVRRCLRPLVSWETLIFFERELSLDIPEMQARIPLEVRVLGGEELRSFRGAFEAVGVAWDGIEPRLGRGDRCSVGLSQGRIVHFRWLTTKAAWVPEIRGTLRPKPGELYVYDAFTVEAARGHGVEPATSSFMLQWGRQQGYRSHVFYVSARNASGLRIVAKIGARKTAVVRCFRFLRLAGSLVTGLGGPAGPTFEFASATSVRPVGRRGLWVGPTRPSPG